MITSTEEVLEEILEDGWLSLAAHRGLPSQILMKSEMSPPRSSQSETSPLSGKFGKVTMRTDPATRASARATLSACARPGLSLSGMTKTSRPTNHFVSSGCHLAPAPWLAVVDNRPAAVRRSASFSPSTKYIGRKGSARNCGRRYGTRVIPRVPATHLSFSQRN